MATATSRGSANNSNLRSLDDPVSLFHKRCGERNRKREPAAVPTRGPSTQHEAHDVLASASRVPGQLAAINKQRPSRSRPNCLLKGSRSKRPERGEAKRSFGLRRHVSARLRRVRVRPGGPWRVEGRERGSRRPSRKSAMPRHTARARSGQDRTNLYQEITEKIIAQLEAGRVPW